MGLFSGSPTPTDPKVISEATTSGNYTNSLMNNAMGMTTQVTPYGSQSTAQTGTKTITDPYTGKTYEVPTYTSTVAVDPSQQFNLNTGTTEAYLANLGQQRLDPKFAADNEALRTSLINQGIVPGSEAYNQAMMTQGQIENDAYNQLYLNGNQQAGNMALAEQQMQMAQVSSLMGGPMMPAYQMAPTNNAGIIGNYDTGMQNQWQQNQAMWGQTMGGLGGLFGL